MNPELEQRIKSVEIARWLALANRHPDHGGPNIRFFDSLKGHRDGFKTCVHLNGSYPFNTECKAKDKVVAHNIPDWDACPDCDSAVLRAVEEFHDSIVKAIETGDESWMDASRFKNFTETLEKNRKSGTPRTDINKEIAGLRDKAGGVLPKHEILWTKEGRRLLDIVAKMAPNGETHGREVLIMGMPGGGKSVLIRAAAAQAELPFVSINASPGMRVDYLVGINRVVPAQTGGISVTFQDGLLTEAVRKGWVFGFEEITRAPQEMLSRLYNLMDGGFAGWSLYENGEQGFAPHKNFWLLSTANPKGNGLYTNTLDIALERRFKLVIEVEKPLVDEFKVLKKLLWDSEMLAKRFSAFAEEGRGTKELAQVFNTGNIVETAKNVVRGLSPMDAVEFTLRSKCHDEDGRSRINTLAEAHFQV